MVSFRVPPVSKLKIAFVCSNRTSKGECDDVWEFDYDQPRNNRPICPGSGLGEGEGRDRELGEVASEPVQDASEEWSC